TFSIIFIVIFLVMSLYFIGTIGIFFLIPFSIVFMVRFLLSPNKSLKSIFSKARYYKIEKGIKEMDAELKMYELHFIKALFDDGKREYYSMLELKKDPTAAMSTYQNIKVAEAELYKNTE